MAAFAASHPRPTTPSSSNTSQGRDLPEWGVAPDGIELGKAAIVSRPGKLPPAENTAALILVEEIEKRTGIRLRTSTQWPANTTIIAITSEKTVPEWHRQVPARKGNRLSERCPEGFRLYVDARNKPSVIWVIGADARGTLFGVGNLLRQINWSKGKLEIASDLDIAAAPAYEIRGHQLGYRAMTNTYDAWSPAQFEQYIRELTFFGANTIEGIPFHDAHKSPVMKLPRRAMNQAIGKICQRYGLAYWAWVPAAFSLKDAAKRRQLLNQCEEFFADTPEFTGFSFPGGDPGHNPPQLVLPFLEDIANLLSQTHPNAKVWLSLQHFKPAAVDYTFDYLHQEMPSWFGGLVAGPYSPPMAELRNRLPKPYGLRDYPDIAHQCRCQYQVPNWDQAFALTQGRESIGPRAAEFAAIFRRTSLYTDGFVTYSEGVNDDVNKALWSALGWDPNQTAREVLTDYARVYFKPPVAERAANGILALEKNWQGPLVDNGAVEGTLHEWQRLANESPDLEGNWRWQMCQVRANYDAYVQRRLLNETKLEARANNIMANSDQLGADEAMADASSLLNQAVTQPISVALRERVSGLYGKLFQSIGLQASVWNYFASGEERGASLDFLDYPLNNRWWLEDQFKAVRALGSQSEKNQHLRKLAAWQRPGPGSFYDNLGNIAQSPRVILYDPDHGPEIMTHNQGRNGPHEATFWFWDNGKSRARLSWQATEWPIGLVYEGLDPNGTYAVRATGYGRMLLQVNGENVQGTVLDQQMEGLREFPVPANQVKRRKLVLTWSRPKNEENLNWRSKSRLAEVWLIKRS